MNDEPTHGAETIRAGDGRAKWLFGAVTALLLLGGGYFVWTSAMQGQESAEVAADDTYAEEPLRADTLGPAADTLADSGATNVAAAPAAAPARRRTPRAIPEETIGITPASAEVQAQDSEEIVVTAPRRPVWARTPTPRRLSALYPERALERGREGEARLHCVVQAGGTLDCERLSETPGGFGPAALRVARTLRHAPRLDDGSDATGTPVRLRIVFRMADDDRHGRS